MINIVSSVNHFLSIFVLAITVFSHNALAVTDAINCRLIIHAIDTAEPIKTDTGRTLKLSKLNGVATCEDGRLLQAQIMQTELRSSANSLLSGYAVYSFENGDTITVQIRGTESKNSAAIDYTIIAGSGSYVEATGMGSVHSVESPWKNTALFNLSLEILHP